MLKPRKIFTLLGLAFIAYVFMRHQKEISFQSNPTEQSPIVSFVEEAKDYINILSADPPSSALTGKDTQILKQPEPEVLKQIQQEPQKPPVNKTNSNKPPAKPESKENISHLQNKIYNILYNVTHTPQGQELVSKLLLNPPAYNDSVENAKEPNPYHNNSIIDIALGEGAEVGCGDTVIAHYIIRLVSGQEVENTYQSGKPLTFQVGDRKVIKGLEYAVIGMKKGGRRRLVVPPKLAYTNKTLSRGLVAENEFVTIDVELLELQPAFKNWQKQIRIFEQPTEKKSRPLLCSSPMYFYLTITDSKEKILYNSLNSVSFVWGSSHVPPAINKAFSDIRLLSTRSVIMPSSLLYNKEISFLPKDVKLPANEMLILDITIDSKRKVKNLF